MRELAGDQWNELKAKLWMHGGGDGSVNGIEYEAQCEAVESSRLDVTPGLYCRYTCRQT